MIVNTYIDYSKVSAENIASFTNPAEITFMNGTIRNEGTYHMFGFDMEPGKVFPDEFSEYSAKKVTYNFDNVTFGVVNKEIMRNWSKSGEGIDVNVNINDCTFDFTGAAKGLAMFNCTGVDIVYDIKITGETKIIADDLNNHKLYNITANDKLDILGSVTLTQTAATAPEFTFKLWESVRSNEERSILPFSDDCDVLLNSLMPYEINMLKPYIIPLFSEMTLLTRRTSPVKVSAYFSSFLKLLLSGSTARIPLKLPAASRKLLMLSPL